MTPIYGVRVVLPDEDDIVVAQMVIRDQLFYELGGDYHTQLALKMLVGVSDLEFVPLAIVHKAIQFILGFGKNYLEEVGGRSLTTCLNLNALVVSLDGRIRGQRYSIVSHRVDMVFCPIAVQTRILFYISKIQGVIGKSQRVYSRRESLGCLEMSGPVLHP